jgi:hypothetical protein
MPFESDSRPAPPIRGALRSELIRDKALGELTHEQLAEKYGRSLQAINQFSARNADEIRSAKQALVANADDEYVGIAIAKKLNRIADADQDLADVIELLENGDLSPTQRKGYLNLKSKLRREVAEEKGELPVRSRVELQVSGRSLTDFDVIAMDEDGHFHGVADR